MFLPIIKKFRLRSFTLLELLISFFIGTVVLTVSYHYFFYFQDNIKVLQEKMANDEEERIFFQLVTSELKSALISPYYPVKVSVDENNNSIISFYTIGVRFYPGIFKVSYWLKERDGKWDLMKRLELLGSKTKWEGVFLHNIKEFKISSVINGDEKTEWESTVLPDYWKVFIKDKMDRKLFQEIKTIIGVTF